MYQQYWIAHSILRKLRQPLLCFRHPGERGVQIRVVPDSLCSCSYGVIQIAFAFPVDIKVEVSFASRQLILAEIQIFFIDSNVQFIVLPQVLGPIA